MRGGPEGRPFPGTSGRHNGPVLSLRRTRAVSLRAAALLAAGGVLLAGCSSGGQPQAKKHPSSSPSPSPTTTVDIPKGVSLTQPGSKLSFGDTATVAYEADKHSGTVLKLTVKSATRGRISDLSRFVLDRSSRASTPYYVKVAVANVGQSRVGGEAVPVYGVDSSNVLLPPATFTTPFQKCPSRHLPDRFKPGDSFSTCLVYLAPSHETMTAASYRPDQAFDPITWNGQIATEKKKHH